MFASLPVVALADVAINITPQSSFAFSKHLAPNTANYYSGFLPTDYVPYVAVIYDMPGWVGFRSAVTADSVGSGTSVSKLALLSSANFRLEVYRDDLPTTGTLVTMLKRTYGYSFAFGEGSGPSEGDYGTGNARVFDKSIPVALEGDDFFGSLSTSKPYRHYVYQHEYSSVAPDYVAYSSFDLGPVNALGQVSQAYTTGVGAGGVAETALKTESSVDRSPMSLTPVDTNNGVEDKVVTLAIEDGNGDVVSWYSATRWQGDLPLVIDEEDGVYVLSIDGQNMIRSQSDITIASGVILGSIDLAEIYGDVDNSGEIDAIDIDYLTQFFGSDLVSSNWYPDEFDAVSGKACDLDFSGEVDAVDMDIAIAGFGATDET